MKRHVIVIAALVLAACSENNVETVEHPFSDSLVALSVEEVTQAEGVPGLMASVTVCQHAAWSNGGACMFTVLRLIDVQEESALGGGERGYLYVVLRVDEVWHGELGEEVVVRLQRGSYDSFHVDERFVMLLRGDTLDWNEGFFSAGSSGSYRELSGAIGSYREVSGTDPWQSPSLEFATEVLREAVTTAYGSFETGEFSTGLCGTVVNFDRCPDVSLVPDAVRCGHHYRRVGRIGVGGPHGRGRVPIVELHGEQYRRHNRAR
ncbi:MAG: hypothetical protein ACI81R_003386 [Bradymonadia bacterium]